MSFVTTDLIVALGKIANSRPTVQPHDDWVNFVTFNDMVTSFGLIVL